ncbi:cyclin-L1 [Syncephalis pseudoplumigaleata]|uniref:Cyclin-L1 n=1 Tax=Syncephalis pseudoplumigaleata TaxID=1712513 RepID=A0A4P9Z2B2_9FUNG|nr:cyclin-L1 [Syncephalis pseudoplumigaleata]|eukprot:RKP26488.1 cyclin-L1 [Syncephalis pseudoplumigaleata]
MQQSVRQTTLAALPNAVVSREQFARTPSSRDGIPASLQDRLRMFGCELIQSAGVLLSAPQVTMATAQVLFQRFYFVESFRDMDLLDMVAGALFVAAKVEETPKRITDIVNVVHFLRQHRRHLDTAPLDGFTQDYYNLRNGLLTAEWRLLVALGFDVHVQLPYSLMVNYLQAMGLSGKKSLVQRAWNYLNDALRTPIYVLHQPHTIACAVIQLAARHEQLPMPEDPPWWQVFEADATEMQAVNGWLGRLYADPLTDDEARTLPLNREELARYLKQSSSRH